MRISNSGLRQNLIHTLNRSLERIERIQMEMATGKRILNPSDDPPGTIRALSFRRRLDDNAQCQTNVSDGLRWNTTTESALTAVLENLMQLKELATRAADDAMGDRAAIGFSADQLLNDLLDLSRSKVDERHVFSGYNTNSAPFDQSNQITDEIFTAGAVDAAVDLVNARIEEGSVVVTDLSGAVTFAEGVDYTVDDASGRITIVGGGGMSEGTQYLASYTTEGTSSVGVADSIEGSIVRRIGSDRLTEVNLLGTEVFQGSVDLFQLTIDLKNALWKDDAEAVRGLLDSVGEGISHVTELLGIVGARAERLENQDLQLQSDRIALEGFLSDVENVDLTSAVVRMQAEEMAYETALATAARMLEISLVNYL